MLALDLFERLGQPRQVRLRDADAGVGHRHAHPIVQPPHVDRHRSARRGELHCIGQQVQHHLLERPVVGLDFGQVAGLQRHGQPGLLGPPAHQPDGVLAHVDQIDRLDAQGHLAGLDLGHVQDVVDQRQQVLARAQDIGGVALVAGVAERAEHLAGHDLGEPVDGVQRRAQLVAHVGQELALGLVGRLGPDLGRLVLAGQLGQLVLAGLQLVDHQPQLVGGPAAVLFLPFDRGDVRRRDHRAAVAGEPLGQLQPASVVQLDLAHPGAAGRGRLVGLDRQGGDLVQLVLGRPRPQGAALEREGVLEGLVPQHQPAMAVEQDKGVGDALDGVAQANLRGLGARLGYPGLGHVHGHAHDLAIAVAAALAAGVAAGVDPAHRPVGRVDPEADLEHAEGGGLAQGVLHPLAVAGMNAAEHRLGRGLPALGQAQQGGHEVRQADLVAGQVPFPDPAPGRLDRHAEAALGGRPDAIGSRRPAALQP